MRKEAEREEVEAVGQAEAEVREAEEEREQICAVFRERCGEEEGHIISGGNGEREPPVPIPNTEVKPLSAEGTWLETARENRTLPDSKRLRRNTYAILFLCPEIPGGVRYIRIRYKGIEGKPSAQCAV